LVQKASRDRKGRGGRDIFFRKGKTRAVSSGINNSTEKRLEKKDKKISLTAGRNHNKERRGRKTHSSSGKGERKKGTSLKKIFVKKSPHITPKAIPKDEGKKMS